MENKTYDMTGYLQKIDRVIENGKYKDTWESLSGQQMPSFMKNGKFGIFIHWGLYSVPAFNNEWYPRNMYIKDSPEFLHHIKTYGEQKDFGHKDFIPMFKAENFNAAEWAELFKKSGAKYCVPVAEHHDGFQMYKSEISRWNAYEMGPKRDILGELFTEFQKNDIVCCASSHRVEHWFFMGHGKDFDSDIKEPLERGDFYWPAAPERELHDIYSEPMPTAEFLEDWLVRSCEIVDKYKPRQFYFDWWIQHVSVKPYLRKFAAYYYNRALEWGEEVAICYKHDAFPFGTAIVDIERGKFADIKQFNWQTDTATARNSWCYTENNIYKSPESLICDLVDIVSKNGCLLLNIGPKADGSISDEDKNILLTIGEWLGKNGEAIYDTIPWRVSSEGPTKTKDGFFTDGEDTAFTHEDIRFTSKGSNIYATVLKWAADGEIKIKSLVGSFSGKICDVEILGQNEKPIFKIEDDGLFIKSSIKSDFPVVIKIITD